MAAPDTSTGSGLLSNFGKLGSDLRKDNSKLATDVAKDAGKIVGFGSQTAADGKQSAPVTNSAGIAESQENSLIDACDDRTAANETEYRSG